MATIERRFGWSLAEHAGDATPDKMQGLLVSRCFDRDKLRDQVRSALVAVIGDEGGVLVADETGFVKKGRSSAGVQRQYTGTTGKIDNCQLGVFLTYHTRYGRALIDRELYLPKSWTDDRDRCRRPHIGDEVAFATKPEQARSMLERAVAAKVPFAWFTGDEGPADTPDPGHHPDPGRPRRHQRRQQRGDRLPRRGRHAQLLPRQRRGPHR